MEEKYIKIMQESIEKLVKKYQYKSNMLILTAEIRPTKKWFSSKFDHYYVYNSDLIIGGDIQEIKDGKAAAIKNEDMEYFYDEIHGYLKKRRDIQLTITKLKRVDDEWHPQIDPSELFEKVVTKEFLKKCKLEYAIHYIIDEPEEKYFYEVKV